MTPKRFGVASWRLPKEPSQKTRLQTGTQNKVGRCAGTQSGLGQLVCCEQVLEMLNILLRTAATITGLLDEFAIGR